VSQQYGHVLVNLRNL